MFFFAPNIVNYVLDQEHLEWNSCEGILLAVYINDA